MIKITYVNHDGARHAVALEAGMTLMEGAVLNFVPGVEGVCGGLCSCGTCHCYLPEAWPALAPPAEAEAALLGARVDRRPGSRLGCQVVVTPQCDGLEIGLPAAQGAAAAV
jgi:2Fe-2S ferredoxin